MRCKQAKAPLGDWAYPEGLFALNESPRGCPQISCIPCDWYGNLPIVYFFPELALSTLRAFKEYQHSDGEVPFSLGGLADLPDFASPSYVWQVALNGTCYVNMVDRVWQHTGDDTVLEEYYASVKKCNTYTMNLREGPGGVISMPEVGGHVRPHGRDAPCAATDDVAHGQAYGRRAVRETVPGLVRRRLPSDGGAAVDGELLPQLL